MWPDGVLIEGGHHDPTRIPRTRAALTLEQFLQALGLPVLAYLREAQVYVNAAFEGKTLFDMPAYLAERELEQWAYLLRWLETRG